MRIADISLLGLDKAPKNFFLLQKYESHILDKVVFCKALKDWGKPPIPKVQSWGVFPLPSYGHERDYKDAALAWSGKIWNTRTT
ncbi:MAG: hypothetical protein VKL39_02215 [Leptolyngbyaceae bacterium]|nr:hypothetical protein [Leptolyngbyaceae bacterium]